MFLGGLWHGAKWKFAMWGTLHGVLLAAERLFRSRGAGEAVPPTKNGGTHLVKFAGWLYTFNVVTFLWLTFLMPDLESIFAFFRGLHQITWNFRGPPVFVLLFYGSVVVCYHFWGFAKEHWPSIVATVTQPKVEGILHGVMAFLIITNSGAPRGFIYFQF
jgi:alginate O-acetyltransferase complex protein AlgI